MIFATGCPAVLVEDNQLFFTALTRTTGVVLGLSEGVLDRHESYRPDHVKLYNIIWEFRICLDFISSLVERHF